MKKILLSLAVPLILSANDMESLFSALKNHSQTRGDTLAVKKSEIQRGASNARLYPKVNLFGSYDHYTEATGLLPVPPNKLLPMISNPSVGQPFSENIYKAGASFSMPLFVKSIFTTAKKAQAMQKNAQAKKRINLLKNEAVIVSANANYTYLNSLLASLDIKEKSLLETQKTIKIKVENGRLSASALYKIDDALNEIAISKNNIELQKKSLISSIETLTGITLKAPVSMHQVGNYKAGKLGSLEPLQEKLRADKLDLKAKKETLYPSVTAHGNYAFSYAKAYNNDKDVNENYGNIGVIVNIPLIAMDSYSSIDLSKIEVQKTQNELEKLQGELSAQSKMLQESLPLLDNSLLLHKKSVANKQKLLAIAKVNYKSGRLSTEEYLRYEDELVATKAKLYKTEALKWQTLMQLAVIYGNNIEEIVK